MLKAEGARLKENVPMRDDSKIDAFKLGDEVVLLIDQVTKTVSKEESYGLASPIHRAVVSVLFPLVAGCARVSQQEYISFLSIAYASLRDTGYQLTRIFPANLLQKLGIMMNTALDSHVDWGSRETYSPVSQCSSLLSHQASQLPRYDQHEISGFSEEDCLKCHSKRGKPEKVLYSLKKSLHKLSSSI